jgi:hypothetical protein
MALSTLAKRLQKVQQPAEEASPDLSQYSLDQLETTCINFGKTHQGKSFNHMWNQEQAWVPWFTQHYSKSRKPEHQIFTT